MDLKVDVDMEAVLNDPDQHQEWDLYQAIHTSQQVWGTDEEIQKCHRFARTTLLHSLDRLALTRCHACSGYGHAEADCPTQVKLSMLGQTDDQWCHLISTAKKQGLDDYAESTAQKVRLELPFVSKKRAKKYKERDSQQAWLPQDSQ